MQHNKAEDKKQVLKNAENLEKRAQDNGNADLFMIAAQLYFEVDYMKKAADCWRAAEQLRSGEK